jgi:hypothetical protein
MVVVKYTGRGLISQGINFDSKYNNGLYDVSKDVADYLIKTFSKDFTLIEKKVTSDKKEEAEPKKSTAKKPSRRKKKVEEPKSEDGE